MDPYYGLLLIYLVIIILLIGVTAVFGVWLFKSVKKKHYYTALIILLLNIAFWGWYKYKNSISTVIRDFEKDTQLKLPSAYKVTSYKSAGLVLIDNMNDLKLQIDRNAMNTLILQVKKTKNYLPAYNSIEEYDKLISNGINDKNNWTQSLNEKGWYYLYSTDKPNQHYLCSIDSTTRTISILKNWNIF